MREILELFKSINFWTIAGSIAAVVGVVFAFYQTAKEKNNFVAIKYKENIQSLNDALSEYRHGSASEFATKFIEQRKNEDYLSFIGEENKNFTANIKVYYSIRHLLEKDIVEDMDLIITEIEKTKIELLGKARNDFKNASPQLEYEYKLTISMIEKKILFCKKLEEGINDSIKIISGKALKMKNKMVTIKAKKAKKA